MLGEVDLVLLLLSALLPLWHGAALVQVARSRRDSGAKLRWMAAILLLIPFGLIAWWVKGGERRWWGVSTYLSVAIVGVAGLLALTRAAWPGYEYPAWLATWSIATAIMYAVDKAAAKAGKDARGKGNAPRVPELVLHVMALVGGVLGGWFGRQVLRHKSSKPVFLLVLVLATGLHASKLAGLW